MEALIKKFISRKGFKKKYPNLKIDNTNYRECIYIDDPILLFRFAGELKHKFGNPVSGKNIFFRGQTKDYPQFIPSIFRNVDNSENNIENRLMAYKNLPNKLYEETHQARFNSEIGGAVLQHYGIRTPWLDFVDNLHIAIWFASMGRSNAEPYFYTKSNQDYGYIYFIQVEYPSDSCTEEIVEGKSARWCDLRRTTNSLSLRPHNQCGIFCTKKNINETNFEMDNFIKAIVKFPLKEWTNFISSIENLFTMDFMFPKTNHDNTYKSLGSSRILNLIEKTEKDYNLSKNELGKIDRYK